jgi:hypothetical protein
MVIRINLALQKIEYVKTEGWSWLMLASIPKRGEEAKAMQQILVPLFT